jgi:DNA end-binding protein Ku
MLERSEVIRGYEHDDSQYVLVEDDELKKITPRSGRTMEMVAFVKEEQIDPIYFDSSYFALPEKDSEKAYALSSTRIYRFHPSTRARPNRSYHVF